MAVIVNRTQKNFTMIANNILRDKELSMKNRGVLCTLCSLPSGWDFSVRGLSAIVPDGVEGLTKAMKTLEKLGYLKRTNVRGDDGRFVSQIEVFTEKRNLSSDFLLDSVTADTGTENPRRVNETGDSMTENRAESKIDESKSTCKIFHQSMKEHVIDEDLKTVRKKIAKNIKLGDLLSIASTHSTQETDMVYEVYETICDMVCYPRETVTIRGTKYPWKKVCEQFLKLRYVHIASILNRLIDADLSIQSMYSYLISTLYTESLVGTLDAEAKITDDYMKFLRGTPYEV